MPDEATSVAFPDAVLVNGYQAQALLDSIISDDWQAAGVAITSEILLTAVSWKEWRLSISWMAREISDSKYRLFTNADMAFAIFSLLRIRAGLTGVGLLLPTALDSDPVLLVICASKGKEPELLFLTADGSKPTTLPMGGGILWM